MIHTIFSAEANDYQRWQSDLLVYSHAVVGQAGPITKLLATTKDIRFDDLPAFVHPSWSRHPFTGDLYQPYNKPAAIAAWMTRTRIEEDTILILDPDCIFLRPIECQAERGYPIGHGTPIVANNEYTPYIAKVFGVEESALDAVSVPIVIHRDDLDLLAPKWLAITEVIRSWPTIVPKKHRWMCEMWGYIVAAAQLGLQHTKMPLANFPRDKRLTTPILHYAWTQEVGSWKWGKKEYKAWNPVPNPPAEAPAGVSSVVRLLNQYIENKERGMG